MQQIARERNITWADPREVARAIFGRPHLEWLEAMRTGEIPPPPLASLLDFEIDVVDDGRIVFAMRTAEWISNPAGVVHGGIIATLLDTVVTLAVTTKLPPERYCTTLDLHTRYVRPLFPTGERIVAEGLAVHVGTTIATSEGRVYDERKRLIAHGTASLAIIDTPK